MAVRSPQTDHAPGTRDLSWATTLAERARSTPEGTPFLFLRDGEHEDARLTYARLHRRAASISTWLRREGFEGKRALLLHQPGVEFIAAFLGCLAGRVVAVPVFPPNPARPDAALSRLLGVAEDCSPAVALVSSAQLDKFRALGDQWPALRAISWIDTESIQWDSADWDAPQPDSEALAFLQYTSGSTSAARGVRVTHRNLTHNARRIGELVAMFEQPYTVLSWLPPYHDMGLIGHVLTPLFFGWESIHMPPVAFLQRPMRWLEAISRYRTTISYAPNFAYELVLRKVRPEHLGRLDLSCWAIAGNGAEPVRAETLDRFCAMFEPCGFRREAFCPSYGLAESTLLVSGRSGTKSRTISKAALKRHSAVESDPSSHDAQVVVSLGKAGDGTRVVIADPETHVGLPPGGVGEIWLRSNCIADGYFQRPEETLLTFGAHLSGTNEGPFLRTGDLGFLHDDEIHVTGRLKDLIIVDGKNHYPQDLEQTVEAALPSLRVGAVIAFSIDTDGAEQLVVVAERPRGGNIPDESAGVAERTIRKAIAERHGLGLRALVWVGTGSLPKTGSGKPQRRACRAAYLDGTLDEAPVTS